MAGFSVASFLAFVHRAHDVHHGATMGMRFEAEGDHWAELSLPYDPTLAAEMEGGVLASGPIVTLLDMATSLAVWRRRGRFGPQATLDLRIDYLRAAVPGRTVYGRGECYRLARRIAFVRGQAHDGDADDPVAHVAGTFMLLDVDA